MLKGSWNGNFGVLAQFSNRIDDWSEYRIDPNWIVIVLEATLISMNRSWYYEPGHVWGNIESYQLYLEMCQHGGNGGSLIGLNRATPVQQGLKDWSLRVCDNCKTRKCSACFIYQNLKGVPRPEHVYNDPLKLCRERICYNPNCMTKSSNGNGMRHPENGGARLCAACYGYWRWHQKYRPRELVDKVHLDRTNPDIHCIIEGCGTTSTRGWHKHPDDPTKAICDTCYTANRYRKVVQQSTHTFSSNCGTQMRTFAP